MTGSAGPALRISAAVGSAVAEGRPVVALETTVFSGLGLPDPAGREAARRVLAALGRGGAIPASAAVLDGVARVGVDDSDFERVFAADRKVGERDLPVAVAQGWPVA